MDNEETINKKWAEIDDILYKKDMSDHDNKTLLLEKIEFIETAGDDVDRAKANIVRANLLWEFGESDEAEKMAKNAIRVINEEDHKHFWHTAHYILSHFYLKKGQTILAEIHESNWRKAEKTKDTPIIQRSILIDLYKKEYTPPEKHLKFILKSDYDNWLQENEVIDLSQFPKIQNFVSNNNAFIQEKKYWINDIKNMISKGIDKPLNILLMGSPGSGKSFFVENINKEIKNCILIEHNISTYETCDQAYNIIMRDLIATMVKEKNVILFLDEFDTEIKEKTMFESFISPMNGQVFSFYGKEIKLNNKDLLKRNNLIIFYAVSTSSDEIQKKTKGKDFISRIPDYNLIESLPSINDDLVEPMLRCVAVIKKYAPRIQQVHKRALLYVGLKDWFSTRELEHSIIRAVKSIPKKCVILDLSDFAVSRKEILKIERNTKIKIFGADYNKIIKIL